jgi:hypothetical protein
LHSADGFERLLVKACFATAADNGDISDRGRHDGRCCTKTLKISGSVDVLCPLQLNGHIVPDSSITSMKWSIQMKNEPATHQEHRRKRAMIVFQILIYGWLLSLFLIQLYMYSISDW